MERKKVFLIGIMHAFVDIYSAFFAVYLVIAGLDPVKSAVIISVATFTGNILQPFLGYLSDKIKGKLPVFIAMLFASIGMSSIGFTQNYTTLLCLVLLGKLGVSLFHPAGANIAGAAGKSRKELGFSIFSTIGTVGFAFSHPLFSFFTAHFGLERSILLAAPSILLAGYYLLFGRMEIHGENIEIPLKKVVSIFKGRAVPLIFLFCIMVLRTAFTMGISFFLAKLFEEWGYSRTVYSSATTVLHLVGAAGLLLSGSLAHRIQAKKILIFSSLIALPFYAAFIFFGVRGNLSLIFVFLALTGFFLYGGHAPNIVLGHHLVPEMTSTVSGLLMGFAWAIANFSQPTIALLDGAIPGLPGLLSGFAIIAVFLLLSALLSIFLPVVDPRLRR